MISNYVSLNPHKSIAYKSLGQMRFYSVMKYVDGIVGNSSSGLLEAPSFKIGTVNIGDRQRGRIRAESVIDCYPSKDSILSSINKIYSSSFKRRLANTNSPYGLGGSSREIAKIISSAPLKNIIKKVFYNIKHT